MNKNLTRFCKLDNETWESRPLQGWRYKIIKRWLKGYTLYFNDDFLANDTKLNNLKETSKEHLEDYTQVETDEYGMRYDQNGEEIWTKL